MPHDRWMPRVVVASGMSGTGVSTIATHLQEQTPRLNVIDAGTQWADILEACMPGFARLLVVTTDDIVSMTAAYALIKLLRDRFPEAPIELLVNRCDTRDALKIYERVQHAAMHFLRETIAYGGAIPDGSAGEGIFVSGMNADDATSLAGQTSEGHDTVSQDAVQDASHQALSAIDLAAVMAIHDIAHRLNDELDQADVRALPYAGERRNTP